MKKGLIFILGIISFLGINTVSAKEIYLEYDTNIQTVNSYINDIGRDVVDEKINSLIETYYSEYSTQYPYFVVSLYPYTQNNLEIFDISIICLKTNDLNSHYSNMFSSGQSSRYNFNLTYLEYTYFGFRYNFSSNTVESFLQNTDMSMHSSPEYSIFYFTDDSYKYNPYTVYYSNFDVYYYGSLYTDDTYKYNPMSYAPNDIFYVQNLENSNSYFKYQANSDFLIEPYYLYDNNDFLETEIYTTINLNDHEYVALSLKDYNTIPDNNFSLYTNMYVKGQVCITPVYNYGLTERKDILTGTQIEGCGSYYPDFTLDKMYILRDDVKNHAIYYLKPYDTSKENVVRIDSSKFNITYISEANASNPQVEISGKVYPTIPYDELTDTATKSEQEGYTPGVSCSFGDFNCYNQYNPENLFDEVFSSPLEMLKNVWSAISTVFSLIGEFIGLLPVPMQTFLYLSFMIAVVLGLLKIIL